VDIMRTNEMHLRIQNHRPSTGGVINVYCICT